MNDLAKCRCFAVTLTQVAKKWFSKLPANSIKSWAQLSTEFIRQFQAARIYSKPGSSLTNIKQREGETLKSYLRHFSDEAARVHSAPEEGVLFAAMGGVRPKTKLWNDLQERDCRTLEEFYARAEKHLRVENAEEALGKPDSPINNSKDRKEKKAKNEKSKPQDQKQLPENRPSSAAPLTRYNFYTELNANRAEVFQANEGRVHFRKPFPIRKERTKRDQNKYCRYHRDVGHDTNDCHELKDEIEDLIRQGKLGNYVRAPREDRARSRSPRQRNNLPPAPEVQGDIL